MAKYNIGEEVMLVSCNGIITQYSGSNVQVGSNYIVDMEHGDNLQIFDHNGIYWVNTSDVSYIDKNINTYQENNTTSKSKIDRVVYPTFKPDY